MPANRPTGGIKFNTPKRFGGQTNRGTRGYNPTKGVTVRGAPTVISGPTSAPSNFGGGGGGGYSSGGGGGFNPSNTTTTTSTSPDQSIPFNFEFLKGQQRSDETTQGRAQEDRDRALREFSGLRDRLNNSPGQQKLAQMMSSLTGGFNTQSYPSPAGGQAGGLPGGATGVRGGPPGAPVRNTPLGGGAPVPGSPTGAMNPAGGGAGGVGGGDNFARTFSPEVLEKIKGQSRAITEAQTSAAKRRGGDAFSIAGGEQRQAGELAEIGKAGVLARTNTEVESQAAQQGMQDRLNAINQLRQFTNDQSSRELPISQNISDILSNTITAPTDFDFDELNRIAEESQKPITSTTQVSSEGGGGGGNFGGGNFGGGGGGSPGRGTINQGNTFSPNARGQRRQGERRVPTIYNGQIMNPGVLPSPQANVINSRGFQGLR